MKRRLKWIIPLAVIIVVVLLFFLYMGQYYHADQSAKEMLASDKTVQVVQTDYGWFFDGPSEEDAFVLYPGAKVEETAYAPLCHKLAQSGVDVCLVKMPFHFAFFGANKAKDVMNSSDYKHWYIGGHSLGGVVAASFAAKNREQVDGLVLLAAYSSTELPEDLETVFIYGSEDTVLNMAKYRESMQYAPSDAKEYVIEGGNHAQFGSYGLQEGDGVALISPYMQVDETVNIITNTLAEEGGKE